MPRRMTNDEFLNTIYDLTQDDYTPLGKYKSTTTMLEFMHNECGRSFMLIPNKFIYRGQRCPHCRQESILTNVNFKSKVFEIYGDTYIVLDEYVDNKTKIRFKHNIEACGIVFEKSPNHFYGRKQTCTCEQGTKNAIRSRQYFEQRLLDETGYEYSIVGEYNGCENYTTLKHINCGNNFQLIARDFYRRKQRCPICYPTQSNGEIEVLEFLKNTGYKINSEKKFQDCKNIYSLPFDFAVYNNEGTLICLIEYDGSQHFTPTGFGSKDEEKILENFRNIQRNDRIKNQYCIDNDISLLRIPYWELENVDLILLDFFNNLSFECNAQIINYNTNSSLKWLVTNKWNQDTYLAMCPKNKCFV